MTTERSVEQDHTQTVERSSQEQQPEPQQEVVTSRAEQATVERTEPASPDQDDTA